MMFEGRELRDLINRTSSEIELLDAYGRCYQLVSRTAALALDLDQWIGIGNRRRIRFLRPRTKTFSLNAGSRTTRRLKGPGELNIAHPLVREHR
jgi:hypothetical protein